MRRLGDAYRQVEAGTIKSIIKENRIKLILCVGEDLQFGEQPDEEGATQREAFFQRVLQLAARTLSNLTERAKNGFTDDDVYSFSLSFFFYAFCI